MSSRGSVQFKRTCLNSIAEGGGVDNSDGQFPAQLYVSVSSYLAAFVRTLIAALCVTMSWRFVMAAVEEARPKPPVVSPPTVLPPLSKSEREGMTSGAPPPPAGGR